jgi:hypothetical protein
LIGIIFDLSAIARALLTNGEADADRPVIV